MFGFIVYAIFKDVRLSHGFENWVIGVYEESYLVKYQQYQNRSVYESKQCWRDSAERMFYIW